MDRAQVRFESNVSAWYGVGYPGFELADDTSVNIEETGSKTPQKGKLHPF